jgi:hypothetical protein
MKAMIAARQHVSSIFGRQPLLRLLAINLVSGIALAALAVGGLLALHPDLHRLIAADQASLTAVLLLFFGFVVTLASCVMGSAIMRIGMDP